jgi:hypothetical protein
VVALLLFCSRSFCARAEELSLRNRFGISVEIDAQKGMYAVKYRGQLWLGRGFVSVLAKIAGTGVQKLSFQATEDMTSEPR